SPHRALWQASFLFQRQTAAPPGSSPDPMARSGLRSTAATRLGASRRKVRLPSSLPQRRIVSHGRSPEVQTATSGLTNLALTKLDASDLSDLAYYLALNSLGFIYSSQPSSDSS